PADQFVNTLGIGQRIQLDQALQEQLLGPSGGLYACCAGTSDPVKHLAGPLLNHAAAFLDQHLPITDVAQVELEAAKEAKQELGEQARDYHGRATAMVAGSDPTHQFSYVLVPATEAGRAYGEAAEKALGELQVVQVPGQA